MPKLGKYQSLLQTVYFLYANKDDAEAGINAGATGFVASVPLQNWPNHYHWIGVTNWHAACELGLSVVRVNRKEGVPDVFDYGPEEWLFIPGRIDVAVIPLDLRRDVHVCRGIGLSMFLTGETNKDVGIDIGDDVFMIGRFLDFDGVETNKPSLRFGNISIMDAPVKQPTGHMGPSIVLDMHSRTGFSGSPVFFYRTSGSNFGEIPTNDESRAEMWIGHTMHFLGLHWGQFPEEWELTEK